MTGSETSEIASVLSASQREWLRGNTDALQSPDRTVRHRIKKRYAQAVADLALLHQSEEISSEDLMQSLREPNKSSNDETEQWVSSSQLEEQTVAHALYAAFNQMETATGTTVDEIDMDWVEDVANQIQSRRGKLEDKWYPRFSVRGAYAALRSAGKTDKQAKQWIEHHWPDNQEALGLLEETEQFDSFF